MTTTTLLTISDLRPAARNPNVMSHSKLAALEAFILQDGFLQPILVRKEGSEIIDGHHRVKALTNLGLDVVEAKVLDVSAEMADAIRIGMNRLRGDLDWGIAADVVQDLKRNGIDLKTLATSTGFSDGELTDLLSITTDQLDVNIDSMIGAPDELPEVDEASDDLDAPTKPWTLTLEYADKKVFGKVKRALRRAAGKGNPLEDGLLRLIDG